MPPIAVLEPSPIWTRRAAIYSGTFLAVVLVGGYFYPLVLLLAPFVGYQFFVSFQATRPGRLRIALYEDKLVATPAVGPRREVEKSQVVRFLAVRRGTNEVVVARTRDVDPRGSEDQPLLHKSDVIMPGGLMRNLGLVDTLERWRQGEFSTESLMPPSR